MLFLRAPLISRLLSVRVSNLLLLPFKAFTYLLVMLTDLGVFVKPVRSSKKPFFCHNPGTVHGQMCTVCGELFIVFPLIQHIMQRHEYRIIFFCCFPCHLFCSFYLRNPVCKFQRMREDKWPHTDNFCFRFLSEFL